jgi:hypothetical protein
MNMRRKLLSGGLGLAGTVSALVARAAATPESGAAGGLPYPQSGAEAASNIVPVAYQFQPGDVRRYGVIANDRNAASANVRALREHWYYQAGNLLERSAFRMIAEPIFII